MSQFGNVSREIQFRKRASGPGIEPTGIVVTPNAPGLVVNDAPSGAAIGFYELARSMGLLATTAGEIGQARAIAQSNERQRLQDLNDAVREAEREATRIEQSDAETARMLRAENEADYGLGVDRGQEWIPAIGSRISAGEFDRLTPEAAAEQILLNETNGQDRSPTRIPAPRTCRGPAQVRDKTSRRCAARSGRPPCNSSPCRTKRR